GSKQGEIVRGEGGQKPVANMGILHGCHWLTPAIARGYSTMRTYRARSRTYAFGPRLVRYPSSTLKCGSGLGGTRSVGPRESVRWPTLKSTQQKRCLIVLGSDDLRPSAMTGFCEDRSAPIEKAPPGRGFKSRRNVGSSETHGVAVCSKGCRN